MKNIKIVYLVLFFLCLSLFFAGKAEATGEACAQKNGKTTAQCVKGESAGWSGLWATKCPGNMNACAYYNDLQCGNCATQGDVCCTTDDMAAGKPVSSDVASPASSASQTSTRSDSTASGLVPCNTNCTLCHLVVGFKRIFDFFIKTLFVATMLGITVSGVFYMVSTGNKKIIEMAKTGLTYSLMAFVIGMGGWIIINTIMVGLGFKHPYGGNWWEFTCDTSKTTGPTGGSTSPNWGVGKDSQNQSGECKSTGNGCGGLSAPGVAGCDNTSSKLSQVMSCINQRGVNAHVSSVTKNNMPDWCQRCVWNYDSSCSHVQNSCHFGGVNCKGTAQAADIGGANLNTLAAVARECGGEYIIFYSSFIHVSVNNAECGCK